MPSYGLQRRGRWQRAPIFGRDARLQGRHDAVGFLELTLLGEPARALRQGTADPPDEDGAMRADQHDPTPTIDAERRLRHEEIREKGGNRYGHETDGLATSEGPATNMLGYQLGEIGTDNEKFNADTDARQKAPKIEPEGRTLEGHEDICRRIPKQRISEDRAPAVFVGQKTAGYRADEQRCDEARDAGAPEQTASEKTRYEQGVMVSMVDADGKLVPEQRGHRSVQPGPVVIRKGLELDRTMLMLSDLFPSWNYRHGDYY